MFVVLCCLPACGSSATEDASAGLGGSNATGAGGAASSGGGPLVGMGGKVMGGGTAGEGGALGGESGGAGSGAASFGGSALGGSTGGGSQSGGVGNGGSVVTGGNGAGGELPATGGNSNVQCEEHSPSAAPIGYGRSATGGGNRAPVVVRSFEEARDALAAYRSAFKEGEASALVVHYDGQFNFASISDVCAQHTKDAQIVEIKEVENVTFRGLAGSSANFGIKVARAKNVIIQNMTMGLLPGGGDADAITLEGNDTNGDVEHVWVDHNELFSSTKDDCEGAGDTEFDGLIDIKKGARNITISYNYLHDHQKTGLLGSSDSDDTERYVTFHHNRYENIVSRTPLQRFGYTHLFNNYYGKIASSGINVRMGGVALIEANYFENALNPVTSRYSPEPGYWDLRDNFVGPGVSFNTEEDTLANADDWQTTRAFPASELSYPYEADQAECVKTIVAQHAGAKL